MGGRFLSLERSRVAWPGLDVAWPSGPRAGLHCDGQPDYPHNRGICIDEDNGDGTYGEGCQ